MAEQELVDALEQERSRYEELSEQTQQLLDKLSQSHEHVDAISVAAQIGRLDVVSLIFAVVGVLLAAAAFFGFWAIRRDAIEAAKEEARQAINEQAASMFSEVRGIKGEVRKNPSFELDDPALEEAINQAQEVQED